MNDVKNIGKGPVKKLPEEFRSSQSLHDHLVAAHRTFYANGDKDAMLKPMLMVVCANGDIVPILTEFSDEDGKEKFAATMRRAFRTWNVIRYAFVSESWMATYDDRSLSGGMPSQREDRKEIVVTFAMERDGASVMSVLELIRDWNTGKVSELREMDGFDGPPSGRFAQLFT